jgi:hypothetical protein
VVEHNESWVVLKFGGTSVSSAGNWRNIAAVLRDRMALHLRPVVVHSAMSGVTDRLEALLTAALKGTHAPILEQIDRGHRDLAGALSISLDARYVAFIDDLGRMADAIAETRELSDRVRARVMAMGELLATSLGATFLNAQGIATAWVDARTVLRAERRHGGNDKAALLSATCDFAPDAGLRAAWHDLGAVVITQGFIAANEEGDTVLLGRGGSDRRAGPVQRQPAPGALGTAAPRAALRRGPGNRQQRREDPASPLHPAGAPVRHSAARLCHPGPRTRGDHRVGERRGQRRAGQGHRHQEGHHLDFDGQSGNVASGRLSG